MSENTALDMTAEFYKDSTEEYMIGAFCVPAKRAEECIDAVGKLLCKIHKLNTVEVTLYDSAGALVEKKTVYR